MWSAVPTDRNECRRVVGARSNCSRTRVERWSKRSRIAVVTTALLLLLLLLLTAVRPLATARASDSMFYLFTLSALQIVFDDYDYIMIIMIIPLLRHNTTAAQ